MVMQRMLTRLRSSANSWCSDCGTIARFTRRHRPSIVLPTAPIVLIVSSDATGAALVGALVEMLGYTVKFARAAESGDDSLRRARPRIYMIDCATTDLCSDDAIGRAIMRGIAVVLLGPASLLRRMRELAARHDLEIVETPPTPGPLGESLSRAARRGSD